MNDRLVVYKQGSENLFLNKIFELLESNPNNYKVSKESNRIIFINNSFGYGVIFVCETDLDETIRGNKYCDIYIQRGVELSERQKIWLWSTKVDALDYLLGYTCGFFNKL